MIVNNNPFMVVGDLYEKMKTKTSNKTRYLTYFTLLFDCLLDMFEWENLPDTIPKRFLESILHTEGQVCVANIEDEDGNKILVATPGVLSGEIDAYGQGTECLAVCPVGEARGKRNIDIAYGLNNDTGTPDMLVYWISHLLGEIDKSLKTNVIYSRLYKIPKVCDEKDKAAFEEIIGKILDGEPKVFASKNILAEELGAGTETLELTDSNKIDKIPYLTQAFDDFIKRFFMFYGQPMQNQNKRAQSISDEIHGADSVSYILPIQMLNCRRALAENINKIFGTNITVKFSETWGLEFNALKLRDTNGNGTPDTQEGEENEPIGNDETYSEVGEPLEPAGTDRGGSEPTETEEEPAEPEEVTDEPDMSLDPEEPEETEEPITVEKVADLLGVTVEEVLELMEGGEK